MKPNFAVSKILKGRAIILTVFIIILILRGVDFFGHKSDRPTFGIIKDGYFASSSWKVKIPMNWHPGDAPNKEQWYFESPDGTKGIYISSFDTGTTSELGMVRVLENARDVQQNSFKVMKGYNFQTSSSSIEKMAMKQMFTQDDYDAVNKYRIIEKVIVAPNIEIRVSIHDYWSETASSSDVLLLPILGSFSTR